jgi:hypothetical protein
MPYLDLSIYRLSFDTIIQAVSTETSIRHQFLNDILDSLTESTGHGVTIPK